MTHLIHQELTGSIIGAYYEVYNHTSRTYPEYIYERAMQEELRRRALSASRQDQYQITYKDKLIGLQRLDLFVVREIAVELKVAERLTKLHKAQTVSYLKTVDKPIGLLLNFGGSQPEFNRLYFNPAKKPGDSTTPPSDLSPDWLYPELCYQIVGGLYEVHATLGAGYVHRIYAKACYHELQLRGLEVKANKRLQVAYKDVIVGDIAFKHIQVENKVMVFPVAISAMQDINRENLKQWLRLSGFQLGIVANFDAVYLQVMYLKT